MDALPITIHRSFIGYVTRVLWAALAIALLVLALYGWTTLNGALSPSALPLVLLYLIAVAAVTLISLYFYSLSYIRLTATGITVEYWRTLFADSDAETAWFRVQSVESKQAGVVGELFGYGTLVIQQAGTEQPIYLTYVPRADYWSNYIAQKANTTPEPVHEVGSGA